MPSNFHLAGIIPVAGQPLDFKMPWHDCMMPLNKDYLAVEHSVVECAYAGCETIWIVCHDDMQPLIRSRLGDYERQQGLECFIRSICSLEDSEKNE